MADSPCDALAIICVYSAEVCRGHLEAVGRSGSHQWLECLLHGGASVALAESLGSLGANLVLEVDKEMAVGLDINANHVRAVTGGLVTGTARPIHLGRSTQVWEIRIEDEKQQLTCISRLTMAVVPRRSPKAV